MSWVRSRRRILMIVVTAVVAAFVLSARATVLAGPATAAPALAVLAYATPSYDPAGDQLGSAATGVEQPARSTGTLNAIALLVDFPDFPHRTEAAFFSDLIFGDKAGLSSVRNYFREVSYGLLDLDTFNGPSTMGWLTVSHPKLYYIGDGGGYGTYPRNRESIVEEALVLIDHLVDFSRYDGNGDGFVDCILIIFAGPQGSYRDTNFQPQVCGLSHPVTLDGVTARTFIMLPELKSVPGDMTIGLYAHEMGHVIGAPDLYDSDLSSQGIGVWSLMARGCYLGNGAWPARPDAWTSALLGWLQPQVVTGAPTPLAIPWVGTSRTAAFKLYPGGATSGPEYFLIENRRNVGTDAELPGPGLLIWHVDETRIAPGGPDPQADEARKLVDLEEAGGFQNLDLRMGTEGWNEGSHDDPFPGATGNRKFDDTTNPDAKTYDGANSGVSISHISDSGMVMTAYVGFGAAPDVPETPSDFIDVPPGRDYHDAIYGLRDAGIIDGYKLDGTWEFKPDNTVLRAQFAKMICGVMGLTVVEDDWPNPSVPFTDLEDDILPGAGVVDSLYPHEYVAICAHNQITLGKTPTTFDPWAYITRAQVISMIVRAVDRPGPDLLTTPPPGYGGSLGDFYPEHGQNMRIAEFNGLLTGLLGFGRTWDPWSAASRGETAQMLWNLMGRLD